MGANGRIAALEVLRARGGRRRDRRWRARTGAPAATTRSSSGGGHNGWSPRPTWARRDAHARPRATRPRRWRRDDHRALPGARVPTLAHTSAGCGRRSGRELDLKGHGLRLVAPHVRCLRPSPDGTAITLWADVNETATGIGERSTHDADRYAEFDRQVRSMAGSSRAGGEDAAGHPARPGSAMRWRAGAGTPVSRPRPARRADRAARPADGRRRLRGRGIRDRRPAGRRRLAGRASTPRWAPGRRAPLRSCWPTRPATMAGAAGPTVFAEGGPGTLAHARWCRRAAGAEIRTGAEVAAISRATGGHRCRAGGWRRDRGTRRGQRDRSEADIDRFWLTPLRSGRRCAGARATSAHPGWSRRSTSCCRACRPSPRRAATTSASPGPDRRGARHRRDGAGLRRRQVRRPSRAARPRGDDPVAGRSVPRGQGAGRDPGHERDRPVHAVRAARGGLGRAPRPGRRHGPRHARRRWPRAWPSLVTARRS